MRYFGVTCDLLSPYLVFIFPDAEIQSLYCDLWAVIWNLVIWDLVSCDLVILWSLICDLWSWDLVTGILWSVTGAKFVKSDGCRPSNGRGVTSPECRHFQSKKSDRSESSAGCPKVHSLRLPKNSLRRPKIIWGCPKIVWGGCPKNFLEEICFRLHLKVSEASLRNMFSQRKRDKVEEGEHKERVWDFPDKKESEFRSRSFGQASCRLSLSVWLLGGKHQIVSQQFGNIFRDFCGNLEIVQRFLRCFQLKYFAWRSEYVKNSLMQASGYRTHEYPHKREEKILNTKSLNSCTI